MSRLNVRKTLGLMLSLVMVLIVVSGCSGNDNNNAGSTSSQQPTEMKGTAHSDEATSKGDMSSLPEAEFSVLVANPDMQIPVEDAPIVKQVYDKTKVRLSIEVPPSNVDEKLNILLASGEYPDVVMIGSPMIAQKFIDGGHVIPLDDLINEYGGQIKKNLGDDFNKLRAKDGKVYHLPSGYMIPGSELFLEAGNSFQFLTNVLENKGWYIPKTFEDVYELLKEVKEKYPKYVPMSLALGDENFFKTLVDTLAGAEGARVDGDSLWTDDNKLIYKYKDERIRSAIQWLNRLYQEGLLDKESPIQNKDALKAKLASEKVFSTIGHWFDTMYEANSIFTQDEKNFRFKYFLPKANESVKKPTYISYSSNYNYGFYVTKKMKDPARFMQFVNWLNTPEGHLAQYGVFNLEGKDIDGYDYFVFDEDGQKVFKSTQSQINGWQSDEQFAAKRGLNFYGMFTFGLGVKTPGYPYQFSKQELDFSNWWDKEQKRANEGFGESGTAWIEEAKNNSWESTEISGLNVEPDTEESSIITKVNQEAYNNIVKLIISDSDDDFNKGYDAFLAKLEKMNVGKWEAKMNDMYIERKKMWE
ncbi:extracellular solute-binding protein [Paenibacillus lignilyticus]|uniref:Extracellular solute-binding protein n=1 Tax=Paenibacillus lignilyticus TaxID=1172615 RepID=A0ABS5CN49_9BACL|nr:extracellular solute-binding protein [Paenibacillus lignilyticus]MBP3967271.1 extracellular solute-binding protein [Paenibacillus lignilyticus]